MILTPQKMLRPHSPEEGSGAFKKRAKKEEAARRGRPASIKDAAFEFTEREQRSLAQVLIGAAQASGFAGD